MVKKILSICLVLVMTVSFSACLQGRYLQTVVSLDKEKISAGLYLAFLLESYNNARNKRDNEDQNVFDTEIDGKKAEEWIKDEAIRSAKLALLLPREAGDKKLVLASNELQDIDKQAKQQYAFFKTYYTRNGIGEQSLKNILSIQKLSDSLFTTIYGSSGLTPVPDAEVDKFFKEHFSKIQYVALPLVDANNKKLPKDKISIIENSAKEFVEKASKGEDFETLSKRYFLTASANAGRSTGNVTKFSNDNFINNTKYTINFNESLTKEIIAKATNEVGYKVRGNDILVYKKADINDEDAKNQRSSNLKQYKQEDYYNSILDKYKNYPFNIDKEAIDYYSPRKIK